MTLTIQSTDSAELICEARKGDKRSRIWFWIPEEQTLRAFKMKQAEALRGIASRKDVSRVLRSDLA